MSRQDEIRRELRVVYDFFEECVNKGHIEPLAEKFYTPNALFMTNGPPVARGSEALLSLLKHAASEVFASVRVEMLETRFYDEGKTVCDLTLIHAKYRDGTSGTQRSCCLFRRTADGWRCDVDIAVNP